MATATLRLMTSGNALEALGRDRYRTVVMNDGFETPDGWKSMDEWLDGPFFEKLESEGAVLLNSDYRKRISETIFQFTS